MSTTIKVSDETKKNLDLLQAKIMVKSGKKVPLQELVGKIFTMALSHEDEVAEKTLPPLEKDPAWEDGIDWQVETDATKVDEYLYGD